MTSVKPLPDAMRSGDADTLREDYLSTIEAAIMNHPRSLQTQIGPSEIGIECDRRIAYKLLGFPERDRGPAWLPTIGTAVHAWLEGVFDADNERVLASELLGPDQERWLVEEKVTPGFIPGLGFISGSCDLYDRMTCTVVDHKIIGPTSLRTYKAGGPSVQYRTQAHLYGLGWENAGHPVSSVAICFLPRNARELRGQAYLWSEPYDRQIALDALARLKRIWDAASAVGPAILPALPTDDAHCNFCPYLDPSSTDPTTACPGHPFAGIESFGALPSGLISPTK